MAIKILIGGSPCTYWSIAQTNNRETQAEGMGWELFKNYLIAKEKFKPDFFLYENNKSASQAIKDQIKEEFGVGVDPDVRFTYINSALVSAQNRQRFYVTNFGDIEQPEDRGILLKDILETGADLTSNDKSFVLTASYDGAVAWNTIERSQRPMVAEPVRLPEYGNNDKSRPVRASYAYKGSGEGSLLTEAFPENPNKQVSDYVAEPLTPFVEDKLDTIVEKYGYLPEKFNPYNKAELTDKSPTLTTCCGSQTSSATVMMVEPIGAVPVNETADGKAQCVRATCYKDSLRNLVANDYDKRTCVAEPVNEAINGKSHTIKAQYYKNAVANFVTNNGFDATAVAEPIRVGSLPRPNGELSESQGFRIYDANGKSVSIKSNSGGAGGKTGLYAIPVEFEDGVPTKAISRADGKTYTVYEVASGQITIKGKQYPIKLVDGYYIIRKLTVRECARLQTMPDNYCKAVSDSQAYKALGNGWTAEVIIHLLNHALKDVPRDEEIIVLSMYDGIATGRYCLDKMGFTNVQYHAYEIDKYPIMVAMDNYPDIIQHGDAFAVREDDWQPPQTRSEWLDDLLGGDL